MLPETLKVLDMLVIIEVIVQYSWSMGRVPLDRRAWNHIFVNSKQTGEGLERVRRANYVANLAQLAKSYALILDILGDRKQSSPQVVRTSAQDWLGKKSLVQTVLVLVFRTP
ncbi:unnamed protein product [Symbiodinium sp. KB8]|nr:unnamed protein product [Symbiodinium sp. KB8]